MRRLRHAVAGRIVETLRAVSILLHSLGVQRRQTGPVNVLFDFVDHVPTRLVADCCARAKEALASRVAPIEGSIVVFQSVRAVPKRVW